MGPDAMTLVFWMLSFKPVFSLFSFTCIKRFCSSPSLSVVRMVSSAYLKLLMFPLAILIPVCASSSLAFPMMYTAYKLDKQSDNMQSWCTPLPIWNQSIVPCMVLTVASWPSCRFLMRQEKWSDIPISSRIFQSLLWSTQLKGLAYKRSRSQCFSGILLLFFYDPTEVGNLISSSSAFSKSKLYIWKFVVHVPVEAWLGEFWPLLY